MRTRRTTRCHVWVEPRRPRPVRGSQRPGGGLPNRKQCRQSQLLSSGNSFRTPERDRGRRSARAHARGRTPAVSGPSVTPCAATVCPGRSRSPVDGAPPGTGGTRRRFPGGAPAALPNGPAGAPPGRLRLPWPPAPTPTVRSPPPPRPAAPRPGRRLEAPGPRAHPSSPASARAGTREVSGTAFRVSGRPCSTTASGSWCLRATSGCLRISTNWAHERHNSHRAPVPVPSGRWCRPPRDGGRTP